jgi:hypothetical protein
MSIRWGYVCRSHSPNIQSENWFNLDAGRDVLREVAKLVRAGQWPNHPFTSSPVPFFHEQSAQHTAPIYWLNQHPHCDVALQNEYGEIEELDPDAEPPGRCIQSPPDTITIPLADLPTIDVHPAHGKGSGYYLDAMGNTMYGRDPQTVFAMAYWYIALAIRLKADGVGESTEPET